MSVRLKVESQRKNNSRALTYSVVNMPEMVENQNKSRLFQIASNFLDFLRKNKSN